MATVSRMKNGSWFIHWTSSSNGSRANFKCDGESFQLHLTYTDEQVTLSMKQKSHPETSGPPEPPFDQNTMRKRIFVIDPNHNVEVKEATLTQKIVQSVTAAYHGILKEMDFTAQSEWRSVTWNCSEYSDPRFFIPYPEMHRQLILRNPTLQIIIHFEDTEQSVSTICKGERQVLNHLSKLLETQSMADVNFVVNGERIGAHSAIVVSGSPVICAMLEKDKFLEGVAKEVKIDDIEPSVFKDILRYLYTGRVLELKEDEMIELFVAADKYKIEALKDLCEQSLQWKINLESVIHYLVLAHIHTAPQLLEASLKYLEANKEQIWPLPEWKELVQSYPNLFFSASRRLFDIDIDN